MIVPPRAASGPPTLTSSTTTASRPARVYDGLTPRQRRYVAYLRDLVAAAPGGESFARFVRNAEETIEEILAYAEERKAARSARRNRRRSRRPV